MGADARIIIEPRIGGPGGPWRIGARQNRPAPIPRPGFARAVTRSPDKRAGRR